MHRLTDYVNPLRLSPTITNNKSDTRHNIRKPYGYKKNIFFSNQRQCLIHECNDNVSVSTMISFCESPPGLNE